MAEVAAGSQVKQITKLSHRIGIWYISEHNKISTNEIQIQEIIDIQINLTFKNYSIPLIILNVKDSWAI